METSIALFYTKPFEIFTSLDPFSKMITLREPRQESIDKQYKIDLIYVRMYVYLLAKENLSSNKA